MVGGAFGAYVVLASSYYVVGSYVATCVVVARLHVVVLHVVDLRVPWYLARYMYGGTVESSRVYIHVHVSYVCCN